MENRRLTKESATKVTTTGTYFYTNKSSDNQYDNYGSDLKSLYISPANGFFQRNNNS
jgi:hypothetical protein